MHTAVFRVVILTNCLKHRGRHPLAAALGDRKQGTITFQHWLPLRRVSLHHGCPNTYLPQTPNISPCKVCPQPARGVQLQQTRSLQMKPSMPETCLPDKLFQENSAKSFPWGFLRKNALFCSCWKILVTFPLRRQAPPGWLAGTWTISPCLRDRQQQIQA